MSKIGYYWERLYPYVLSMFLTMLFFKLKIHIDQSKNYTEILNGLVTLDSIILGFLGAVMPVILSMKNESKFVKYVFEKDKKNLFSKYLKSTVILGLLNAALSLIMHARDIMTENVQFIIYNIWIFITASFLISTYRSMSHMITLVFSRDQEKENNKTNTTLSEEQRANLRERHKM